MQMYLSVFISLYVQKDRRERKGMASGVQWGGRGRVGGKGSMTFCLVPILDLSVSYSDKYNSVKSTGEGTLKLNTNRKPKHISNE